LLWEQGRVCEEHGEVLLEHRKGADVGCRGRQAQQRPVPRYLNMPGTLDLDEDQWACTVPPNPQFVSDCERGAFLPLRGRGGCHSRVRDKRGWRCQMCRSIKSYSPSLTTEPVCPSTSRSASVLT
jgi:hypothetical protein